MVPAKIELTGHIDGYCVRYLGHEVCVFPNLKSARTGYRLAHEAAQMLRATLAKPVEGAA